MLRYDNANAKSSITLRRKYLKMIPLMEDDLLDLYVSLQSCFKNKWAIILSRRHVNVSTSAGSEKPADVNMNEI